MRVHFDQAYDHTFPSRAMVHYRKGWSGSVRDDVGKAAIAAGKARPVGRGDQSNAAADTPPPPLEPPAGTPNLQPAENSD